MANLRTGKYGGKYYGSYFSESEPLTEEEMKLNAVYLYQVLHYIHGWSMNAVAGMLGNMQAESSINPGRWQSDDVGDYDSGYGLVQWTPATKYTNWCSSNGYTDPSEMDAAIARIIYEVENKQQWYATSSYNFSFKTFTTSTESPSYLAKSFLLNYERPADQSSSVQEYRGGLADFWYAYLAINGGGSGDTPIPTPTPSYPYAKNKRGYKFVLYANKKRRTRK